jgi:hypothetical protein
LKLVVVGVVTVIALALGAVFFTTNRTKPSPEGAPRQSVSTTEGADLAFNASSLRAQIDSGVQSLITVIDDGLAADLDAEDAHASLHAAIEAVTSRSMAPQIERATARSYIAQRDSSVITNMRRHHRTQGYFKNRPVPYADLTPDEWVRFIDRATYEELVELYATKAPVISEIDWSNTTAYTRAAGEPWIDSQRKLAELLTSLGVREENRSIGGGRSYYSTSEMAPAAYDPRGRASVHLIVPMTTSTGEPLVCAYEFVVNEQGQLDPYQFMRGQRVEDDRGEPVPLLMPPF